MRGEVARISESVEPHLPRLPLVHLAYLHIKLLSEKATETAYSNDQPAIDAAIHTINILHPNVLSQSTSPLEYHFAGLSATALALAIDANPITIIESLSRLRQFCDNGRLPPAWSSPICSYITTQLEAQQNRAAAVGAAGTNDRGGLQHLADAAVGAENGKKDKKVDWSALTARGYLTMFE